MVAKHKLPVSDFLRKTYFGVEEGDKAGGIGEWIKKFKADIDRLGKIELDKTKLQIQPKKQNKRQKNRKQQKSQSTNCLEIDLKHILIYRKQERKFQKQLLEFQQQQVHQVKSRL